MDIILVEIWTNQVNGQYVDHTNFFAQNGNKFFSMGWDADDEEKLNYKRAVAELINNLVALGFKLDIQEF